MGALHASRGWGTLTRRPRNWGLTRRSAARGFGGSLLRPAAAHFSLLQYSAGVEAHLAIFLACSLAASLPYMHSGLRRDDDRCRWTVTDAAAETAAAATRARSVRKQRQLMKQRQPLRGRVA
jgi:hypothetical protein